MFKKFLAILSIVYLGVFLATPALAAPELRANAGMDRNGAVNRPLNFSAQQSLVPPGAAVSYTWDFGNGTKAVGPMVSQVYNSAGVYRVKLLASAEINGRNYTSQDETIVRVDKDLLVLISDRSVTEDNLNSIKTIAGAKGILLVNISENAEGQDYVIENELSKKILASSNDLQQASGIVIWTQDSVGINAFVDASNELVDRAGKENLEKLNFANKYFVIITDKNLKEINRSAQDIHNKVKAGSVILTNEAAQTEIFSNVNPENLVKELKRSSEEYNVLGPHTKRDIREFNWLNAFPYLIGYMVDRGVPINTIYLILVLPIIATLVAFSRQIIGFRALGIYTPSIIAVSFLSMGLQYGTIIFFLTLAIGTLGRLFARKVKISYLPRMAIMLTIVCLSVFIFFLVGAKFPTAGIVGISIFPILIIILLTEEFISLEIERGLKSASLLFIETLFLSVLCYLLASWNLFREFILIYPETVIATLLINILIGRWTGLRLLEYYRFRKVIKNVELAEKK